MAEAAVVAVGELSFEKALEELEKIVARLERGEVPLAESIAIYERGEELKKHCERLPGEAEARGAQIRGGGGGQPRGLRRSPISTPAASSTAIRSAACRRSCPAT